MAVLPSRRAKATEDGTESLIIPPAGRRRLIIMEPDEVRIQERIEANCAARLAGHQRAAGRSKPAESPEPPPEGEPIDIPPRPQRIAAVQLPPKQSQRLLEHGKLELMRKSIQDDPEEGEEPVMCQMQSQSEVADRIMDALQLVSFDDGDAQERFEADEQESVFFIPYKEISFPVVHDDESRQHHAESMKACLIREIGNELAIRVMEEIRKDEERLRTLVYDSLDPGIVTLARQLFVLDFDRA
jgi:hypothetical protein